MSDPHSPAAETPMTDKELQQCEDARFLLPEPAPEVVGRLLSTIAVLKAERSALEVERDELVAQKDAFGQKAFQLQERLNRLAALHPTERPPAVIPSPTLGPCAHCGHPFDLHFYGHAPCTHDCQGDCDITGHKPTCPGCHCECYAAPAQAPAAPGGEANHG